MAMPIATPTSPFTDDLPGLTATPPGAQFWGLCGPDVLTPAEVPPPVSVASDRFIKRIERLSRRDEAGLTHVSRRVLELLEALHGDTDRDDLVEVALLLEASAGNTEQFLRSVANPEVLPTDHGDLFVLDYLALTPMLARDIDNPRPFLRLGTRTNGNGYNYTSPILGEYDRNGFRTLEVASEEHFVDLHGAHRNALGFTGQVRDHRDRLDLERGARLGILKPATAAPVWILDRRTGKVALQLGLVDANRRFTLVERLFDAVMPGLRFGAFARRHLFDGETVAFRRFTAEDAHDARETLADAFADIDAPGDTGEPEADQVRVRQWANRIDENDPLNAAILRTRVMRCRVVIGLDPASALAPRDPMKVAVGAYRDQLHLPDLSDVEWDKRATEAMVAHDLLRQSREVASVVPATVTGATADSSGPWQDAVLFDPTEIGWHVPGISSTHRPSVAAAALGVAESEVLECAEEVAALTEDLVPAVGATAPSARSLNALDLILATIATVVCRAQPMTPVIGEVLAHHRMANSPKARGQLAAAVLGPLLRLPAEGSDTARAYAALSRTAQHGLVFKLDESRDPLNAGVRWVDLIGTDWFEVVDRARAERAAGAVTATGERVFGPGQILLALAAAIAMEVSPAVVFSDQGPSPYQLTLSGLGGQRGAYKGDPLAVLLALTVSEAGISQLWELVVAAIADERARPARSIRWDPEAADGRMFGPFLTEVDVRDAPWGHGIPRGRGSGSGADGDHPGSTRHGAAAFVASIFSTIANDLEAHAAQLVPVVDRDNRGAVDPELDPDVDDYGGRPAEAYFRDGVDQDVADRIVNAADAISNAAMQGKVVRETTGGGR
jgi:hypothetical protein